MGSAITLGTSAPAFTLPATVTTDDINDTIKHIRSEANQVAKTDPQAAKILDDLAASLTNSLGQNGLSKSSCGTGKSWLEAIAEAMGRALGQMAQKLVDETNQLQNLSGSASGSSGAQEFQAVMAKFQADSQMFSMLSNAYSTSIKSIGEGMSTMASKQ
jgi:hypothetical protein